jgi:hypothetical protein
LPARACGFESHTRHIVGALHIYNDQKYPLSNARIAELMRLVKPGGRPHSGLVPGCVNTTVSWKHWPCLFSRHGPGREHERPIVLDEWQRDIVIAHPAVFLRGLFHSDGCRARNWTQRMVAGQLKRYDYPRWQFCNNSADIRSSAVGRWTWSTSPGGSPTGRRSRCRPAPAWPAWTS